MGPPCVRFHNSTFSKAHSLTHLSVVWPRRYGLDPDGFIEFTDETLPVVVDVREDTPHTVIARHFTSSLQGSLIHYSFEHFELQEHNRTLDWWNVQFAMIERFLPAAKPTPTGLVEMNSCFFFLSNKVQRKAKNSPNKHM